MPKATASDCLCVTGVCNPERTQGLKAPAPKGKYDLIVLRGPGLFVAAHVSKQGGPTGLTFVELNLDGRNVVNLSYIAAANLGLTQQNPYGLVLLGKPSLRNLTIGWPVALRFEKELRLGVTVNETGVVQILANVIHGTV